MAMNQASRTQKTSPSRKWPLIWISCAVALILVLAMAFRFLFAPAAFPRLEVAGYQISQEQYIWAMYQARNDVLSEHADAGISLKDWGQETELGDPCQLVADRALEILAEYYAVATLAVERGYLADASYEAMLRDMEEINRKRQEAIESGGIVTGTPQFTRDDFITYRASSIRLQFCNDPDNPDVQLTQEDIRQRYEADKANLYVQPDDLELAFLVINAAPDGADGLESELEILREKALETGDLSLAMEDMHQLKSYFQEISVNRGTYSMYSRSHGDILAYSAGLQTGEISQVFRQDGWLCLIQCRQRIAHDYMPLEDVESVVVQSIRESRYDQLIADRAQMTEISVNLTALYRYTAEQFT